jgi:hypothetical protein
VTTLNSQFDVLGLKKPCEKLWDMLDIELSESGVAAHYRTSQAGR